MMKRLLTSLTIAGLLPLALAVQAHAQGQGQGQGQAQGQAQAPGEGQTASPAKVGDQVTITTSGRTIVGTARASRFPGWISVQEAGTGRELWVPIPAIQSLAIGEAPGEAPGGVGEAAAPGAPRKKIYLVYVHGICRHSSGFWRGWWQAMRPFTPEIDEANIREVLWSDLVNGAPGGAEEGAPEESAARKAEREAVEQRLRDTLRDRAERQRVEAPGGAVFEGGEEAPGGLIDLIPGLDCIDDFTSYLLDASIRQQIVARFTSTVGPLLNEEGAEVVVISHSWGTVVALDGLRALSNQATPGRVSNLFTVGAALSIGEVRRQRYPGDFIDRPANVQRWVNLDARHDVVGGPMRRYYGVDFEYLNLPAIGCGGLFPDPVCAHSSYFEAGNIAVNRDIFGRFIGIAP